MASDKTDTGAAMTVTEIRVHGVSGTPPASMLNSQPVLVAVRPEDAANPIGDAEGCAPVKRRKGRPPIEVSAPATSPAESESHAVVAYNWSRLTSGRRRYAFWILLLPYTLVNAAGWMLPPRSNTGEAGTVSPLTGKVLDIAIRLTGAAVTAVFTLFTAATILDLVLVKCRPNSPRCAFVNGFPASNPAVWLLVGTGATLLIVGLVSVLVRRDEGPGKRAGRAEMEPDLVLLHIDNPELWKGRSLSASLAFLHFSAAAVVLVWVLVATELNSGGASAATWLLATVATGYLLLCFVAASTWATSDRLKPWAYSATALAMGSLVVAAVDVWSLSDVGWEHVAVGDALSAVAVVLTGVVTAMGGIVWLATVKKGVTTSGATTLMVFAALLGSSFGAGSYMLVRQFLIGRQSEVMVDGGSVADAVSALAGIDWTAFGLLAFLLIQVAFILATMRFVDVARDSAGHPYALAGLRNVTNKIRGHLKYPAGLALVGGFVFLFQEVGRIGLEARSPFADGGFEVWGRPLSDAFILGLLTIVGVLAVLVLHRYVKPTVSWLATAVMAGLAVYFLVMRPSEISIAGFTLALDSLRNLAVSLAVVLPAGFIVSRVVTMLRDREQRRGIGILWDLGSFWPRWYHPFSAPPYTPVAVPDLARFVKDKAQGEGRVIVAAHSQGSVISMAALLTIDPKDEAWSRIALLTYGNPAWQLYASLFPAQFNDHAVDELRQRLTGEPAADGEVAKPRWWNLWRLTDPIGGHIPPLGERSVDIDVCLQDGHSGYELTGPFRDKRNVLMTELA